MSNKRGSAIRGGETMRSGMYPQEKEHLEPPKAGEVRKASPSGSLVVAEPCQPLDFTLLTSY